MTARSQRWRAPLVCLALAALTFAVFGQTLRHPFFNFDDGDYVYDNAVVAQGLTRRGLAWAFTQSHFGNWHPLTWLSHELDCQLYGLNPGRHHLTNVLLHAATAVLLFLGLRRMTGAFWRAAFVAAVFAIHPMRVESVAWVAERKDVLSGLFFMLAIGAYARYAARPKFHLYVLSLGMFALGLMCKPMLVTLPLVLLLLDEWPLKRTEPLKRLLLEKAPFLALSAAVCAITLLAQNPAMQPTASFPLSARLGNALASCLIYLRQMFWPAGLAVLYPYSRKGPPLSEVALAGVLLAGLSALAWRQRRRQPWIWMGWLWYLVMLLPVVGIIQVGEQAHADRYTYLPQIGLYVAVTWWAAQWRLNRAASGLMMAAIVAVLSACAWKQTAYWRDSETAWKHCLACTIRNESAHYNLANALLQNGKVEEAIVHYQQALEIRPTYESARYNLANAFLRLGQLDAAIFQYQEALAVRPDDADALVNLGTALLQKGQLEPALVQYRKALELRPGFAAAHVALGTGLMEQGRVDEAIAEFQIALQLEPGNEQGHLNLGSALLRQGRFGEAIVQFRSLPKNPIYLQKLASTLARAGRFSEAVETAREASRLAEAQSNTALAGALQGEIELYQAARTNK